MQVFRNIDGKPVKSRTRDLQLRLRDFTTESLAEPEGRLYDPIIISSAMLYAFLELAEMRAALIRTQSGVVRSTKPWTKKRRRD